MRLADEIVVIAILRAGLGMTDGALRLIPEARVGHLGLYRDEESLQPVGYYESIPRHAADAEVVVVDPMLATGGSAVSALDRLKRGGVGRLRFVCLVAAPEGDRRGAGGASRGADLLRGDRPRARRARLHPPGARRRGRPHLRHGVAPRWKPEELAAALTGLLDWAQEHAPRAASRRSPAAGASTSARTRLGSRSSRRTLSEYDHVNAAGGARRLRRRARRAELIGLSLERGYRVTLAELAGGEHRPVRRACSIPGLPEYRRRRRRRCARSAASRPGCCCCASATLPSRRCSSTARRRHGHGGTGCRLQAMAAERRGRRGLAGDACAS